MRKLIAVVLLLAFSAGHSIAATIALRDQAGRSVSVPCAPQRIVCLGPGALRLIVYLGSQDRVVGVEAMEKRSPEGRPYWIASPALARLPVCGPGGAAAINKKPDIEAVLKLNPQVVFVTWMDAALADTVQATLRIPVIVLTYGNFATFDTTVYEALRIAGRVLGREQRAEAVIDFIETQRRQLAARTGDIAAQRRTRAYAGGIGFRGSHGIESSQTGYVPLDWAGACNVADESTQGFGTRAVLDRETLLAVDPEVIFIDGGGLDLVRADFQKRPTFYRSLRAFRERRVHVLLPFNFYATNIGTALADAWAVGAVLYPDRFADIDPAAQADEIYEFLVGAPVYAQMQQVFGSLGRTPTWIH